MEHLGGFFDGQTQCENDLVSAHDVLLHDDSKPQAHAKKVSSPLLGLRHLTSWKLFEGTCTVKISKQFHSSTRV